MSAGPGSGGIYRDDPDLYDLQYARYREDVPFYLRVADDHGGPILELGAGTGRVTEALARAGHEVVAVDAEAAMLERARVRLAGADGVRLVHGDMRSARLGATFPVVIAPFNTLMHAYTLDDQDRTLATVTEHLADGGVFAFDLFRPRFGAMDALRREPEWADLAPNADLFLVQHHDEEKQLIHSTYYYDTRADDGTVRRRKSDLVQRYYRRYELERLLRGAGLPRVDLHGGFDMRGVSAASPLFVGTAARR